MTRVRSLVIPNRRPYNDLWVRGLLPFKTRGVPDRTFEANYGKVVYLYNSGRIDSKVVKAHGMANEDLTPAYHIVAKGVLRPFVPITDKEARQFEDAVWNGGPNENIYAMPFKLDLENLQAVTPIPFAWPPGPVRHTWWVQK